MRTALKSMEHYLDTFVFDRLSRMEAALVRLFAQVEQSESGQEVPAGGSVKRFSGRAGEPAGLATPQVRSSWTRCSWPSTRRSWRRPRRR